MYTRIQRRVILTAVERARRVSPFEACGLLLARADIIEQAVALENLSRLPHRFDLDALAAAHAERQARAAGRRLAGYFHSHVDGDVWPSASDRTRLLWPELPPFLHLIVSPDGCWQLYNMRGGAWACLELAVVD